MNKKLVFRIVVGLFFLNFMLPFSISCTVAVFFLLQKILNYLPLENIEWATWVGSVAAICVAVYTRRIWLNNLIREEVKEITELHQCYVKEFLNILNIGYISSSDFVLATKLVFYKTHFLYYKIDFSKFILKLESSILIKNKNISKMAEEVKRNLEGMEFNFNGFIKEIEAFENEVDLNNKIIILEQAEDFYKRLMEVKSNYEYYYPQLKKELANCMCKI